MSKLLVTVMSSSASYMYEPKEWHTQDNVHFIWLSVSMHGIMLIFNYEGSIVLCGDCFIRVFALSKYCNLVCFFWGEGEACVSCIPPPWIHHSVCVHVFCVHARGCNRVMIMYIGVCLVKVYGNTWSGHQF